MKKNILITGANGLIGSSLIKYLSNKNLKITGVFNKNKKNLIKKKILNILNAILPIKKH